MTVIPTGLDGRLQTGGLDAKLSVLELELAKPAYPRARGWGQSQVALSVG